MLDNCNVVITGGAGFVGSALCRALVGRNKVISIDNYFTGTRENHVDGVEYIEDCSSNISKCVSGDVDIVFHFGEYSRVEQSFEDFDFVMKNNTSSLPDILKFCNKNDAKLVYSGSSTKFTSDSLGYSQSPYAFTKAVNTQLIEGYAGWFGLRYAIVYFYNVYGPGEIGEGKYATLIAKFLRLASEGKALSVTLPGSQQRNFTHIADIVDGILLVTENAVGDLYGIGSDDSYTVMQVAEMISDNIEFSLEKKGNRTGALVENSKLKALGWSPNFNLQEYVDDYVGG